MRTSTRWTLLVLAILTAVTVGLLHEFTAVPAQQAPTSAPGSRAHRDADTPQALAPLRQRAALPPCPTGSGPGPERLRGVVVECAADGAAVDAAGAVAGHPVVLNLWAYWCGPCAEELPAMQDYQRRVGDAVEVITVHQDENESAALLRLAELGVRLPVLQDGRRSIAAALSVPNVMPTTVVLRPDGSVAQVLPQPFTSADEIATAVNSALQ